MKAHKKRMNKKFTPEEDQKLKSLIKKLGENAWEEVVYLMEGRNMRQCKERWTYYLSPKVKNLPWTPEDDARLIKLATEMQGKWVQISKKFKGRNDTQIKNRWNTLKKTMILPSFPKKTSNDSPHNTNISDLSSSISSETEEEKELNLMRSFNTYFNEVAHLFEDDKFEAFYSKENFLD